MYEFYCNYSVFKHVQSELNAAVAERDAAMTEKETAKVKRDAALKKIEELQVQLAEIHQSEVSTVSMGEFFRHVHSMHCSTVYFGGTLYNYNQDT